MTNSKANELADALQDLREAYLVSVSKRLISKRIPDGEIIVLSRTLPAHKVIRKLKRSYLFSYLRNKMKRAWKHRRGAIKMAAKQGDATAQYKLGVMYRRGQGVPQDNVRAQLWWSLAAAQGHEVAMTDRDSLADKMTPDQNAEAQRLAREWKPE